MFTLIVGIICIFNSIKNKSELDSGIFLYTMIFDCIMISYIVDMFK